MKKNGFLFAQNKSVWVLSAITFVLNMFIFDVYFWSLTTDVNPPVFLNVRNCLKSYEQLLNMATGRCVFFFLSSFNFGYRHFIENRAPLMPGIGNERNVA